jgi:hypothetical protein
MVNRLMDALAMAAIISAAVYLPALASMWEVLP